MGDYAVGMTGHTEHGLLHSALFYRSEHEYVDSVVHFVSEWLTKACPVLVAVPGAKMVRLHSVLRRVADDEAHEVVLTDICQVGRNPGRILGWMSGFVQRHRGRPVRIIGESMWPGRSSVEYPACVQHEALVNLALEGQDATCLCLYDAVRLDDSVLADARLTHPLLWQDGAHRRSAEYAVDVAVERGNQPLQTHPAAVTFAVGKLADLSGARQWCAWYGSLLGMSADRIADLQLVVTELATSSLQRGSARCRLAFWHHDNHVVCEARGGAHLADPLVGRRPPSVGEVSASGLFVVNAVADLVRTYTSRAGTTIHAYIRLDRSPGKAA
ncbi:anti-sigma regulatory factor [Mycobacterium botniense]|uniref:Anti-sigma regulatory factor n=2 Tax=Mycobacterium botniense TaxID=84962 RepID=A0A7I9XTZ4_9MYCO|nr:anti-sigma regulatory factor [Mycobacterium botniense]